MSIRLTLAIALSIARLSSAFADDPPKNAAQPAVPMPTQQELIKKLKPT